MALVREKALWVAILLVALLPLPLTAQVATTTVQGTIYRADGTAATGSLLVSWPAFTTASNQAVAAGSTSTSIGTDGFVSLSLAPNQNAYPAGTYYTAVYHLSDGTVNREYWVVPAAASASIGAIRAQVEPATVAVQPVSKSYVDSSISALTGNFVPLSGGTMSGPLVLSGDPTAQAQAATKHYADNIAAADLPLAGGNMLGALQTPNLVTKAPLVNIEDSDFGFGQPILGISVTNGACTSAPAISIPAPSYSSTGTQATASCYCINGQTACRITFPGGGYVASQTPTISGGGTNAATAVFTLLGTPNAADPSGASYSESAIVSAVDYALMQGKLTGITPQVYVPQGKFKLGNTVRLPCGVHFNGDGPNASILEPTNNAANGITVYSSNGAYQPDAWTCEGSISNLAIYTPNGHNYQATELEVNGDTGYRMDNLRIAGGGGRGISLLGGAERNEASNIEIDTVRWPLLWVGNENHIRKLNIASPGEAGDSYCYGTGNCVNGVYPGSTWTKPQVLVSVSANGSTGTAVISGGSDVNSSNGVSPLLAGHWFELTGVTGAAGLNGFWQITRVANNSPSAGQYTLTFATTVSGSGVVSGALYLPAILPDRNAAVLVSGANVVLEDGSIKSLWYAGCFDVESVFGSKIASFYCEGYPVNGQPHLDSDLVEGNLPPQTTLTGALSGTGFDTVVGVAASLWFPIYYGDPLDILPLSSIGAGVAIRILPQDYVYGSTAPSAYVSGVEQGQWEDVYAIFSSDGMHVTERGLSTSTAPTTTVWPAGSIITSDLSGASYGSLQVASNHFETIDPPGSNWAAYCVDNTQNVCATVIGGDIPNGMSTFTTGQRGGAAGESAGITFLDNEWWTGGTEAVGQGYTKARGRGGNFVMLNGGARNYKAYDASVSTGQLATDYFINVEEADGSYPYSYFNNMDEGVYFVSNGQPTGVQSSYSRLLTGNYQDATTGSNPSANYNWGLQFQNSYCYYDTPSTVGGHSQNRWCDKGAPTFGSSNSGWEYDVWNGTSWVNAFGITGQANGTANLQVSGSENVAGGVTASTINGEITVDGVAYANLNSAWNAAVAQANSSGQNQTVRLGPGKFNVTATLTEPGNGACVSLLGSAGTATTADITTASTTLNVSAALSGDVFYLGNANQAQGCTFKDLNILANLDATHGFELQWFRGLLIDNVAVNDTTAEGILLGEETTTSGHQANFLMRNTMVSYSSASFTPASRPAYGVHLEKTAMDSHLDDILVRNALTASVYNEGTGNTGYLIHGFGFPYTCTTAPCANNASSSSAANASYATSYVIYDTGGAVRSGPIPISIARRWLASTWARTGWRFTAGISSGRT